MADNIIQLPDRSNRPSRTSLADQLRRETRVPNDDRPVIAKNLGQMAADINQAKPLEAAKSLFKSAWPNDDTKWTKRKRLMRLPGEDLGNPQDYGQYEAAGPAYLRLAETIAKQSGPFKDDKTFQSEVDRRVATMLWGTTYRANTAPLEETSIDARNLILELSKTIENRLPATGLTRLWKTMKTSPFRPLDGAEIDQAVVEKEQLTPMIGRSGQVLYFHDDEARLGSELEYGTYWASPRLQIGWLVRRVRGDMLVLPHHLSANNFDWTSGDDPRVTEMGIWARAWGGGDNSNPDNWAWPSHEYEESLGHGWVSSEFDIINLVEVELVPANDGTAQMQFRFGGPSRMLEVCGDIVFPSCLTEHLIREKIFNEYMDVVRDEEYPTVLRGDIFFDYPALVWNAPFKGLRCRAKTTKSDTYIELDSRLQQGRILGLLDIPGWNELLEKRMSVTEAARDEYAEILVGNDHYCFISKLVQATGIPVPCRSNSLAATLLRNAAHSDSEARLLSLLENKAKQLAERGFEYHETVLEFYQNAIKKI